MATFLTGNDLNAQLESLFEYANEYLLLVSPYIKLHERYASCLKTKKSDPNFKIIVVFGKNEKDFSKSMKEEDFNFFKDFPNIEIRYEKRLHAKYYANENSAILTSMNLYDHSQDNNIEAGVFANRKGVLSGLLTSDTLENQAAIYFDRVIDQADLLFKKEPQFETTMLGLSRRYINSRIETDKLSNFFDYKIKKDTSVKRGSTDSPLPSQAQKSGPDKSGFCIRTGVRIPFDQKNPMCEAAYQSWKKFSKSDYPEKYCHFSGEVSNGETTYSKPILRKNWAKAKEIFNI